MDESRKRNYLALLVRRTLAGFSNNMSNQYINVYILKMGFTEQDIGLLRSIAAFLSALPSSTLNFVADVTSRKKAYLIGLLLEILSALLFFLDNGALVVILALVFYLVAFQGLRTLENILIADSLRGQQRAFGFGVIYSLTVIASLVAPVAAAYITNLSGGISVEGIRPVFLIQLLGLSCAFMVTLAYIRDIREVGEVGLIEAFKDSLNMIKLNPWLKRWILLEILGGYVFSLSMPFEMIYAVEVKGADEFTLGFMGLAMNLGSFIASPLLGKLADKIGRVKAILLVRPLYYLSVVLFLTAPTPPQLIAAWFIRGLWFASIASFQTLAVELVPYDYRGRWNGVRSLIVLPLRSPGSLLGGILYSRISPETPFIVAALIDLILRVPLIYATPETLDRRKYLKTFKKV